MKFYIIFICCLFGGLSVVSYAEEEKTYTAVVDLVYEWSADSTAIQVGDYTISGFDTVWLDNGDGEIVQTTRGKIQTGNLVRALIINRNEDGFWIADKIIVLAGDAFSAAVAELPEMKRNEIINSQARPDATPPAVPQSQQPVLKNGVWVN